MSSEPKAEGEHANSTQKYNLDRCRNLVPYMRQIQQFRICVLKRLSNTAGCDRC